MVETRKHMILLLLRTKTMVLATHGHATSYPAPYAHVPLYLLGHEFTLATEYWKYMQKTLLSS